ncbi:hypothetical protein B0H14DRAFT_1211155 [Mycena olivaceomarginata]|nr:hypothetical protein B0H14DRAFT_1211155 [Mycena olivaceomarginata]
MKADILFHLCLRTITYPHLDAWGWCAITSLGSFNPDEGSSVFIPSPIVQHSSFPIRSRETCCSFTQYTAEGSFDGRP